jgi:MFS transporter, DHA2 family, multidrug resistance protein
MYGPNRYWFSDASIRYATIFAIVVGVLSLVRQASLKRPLIDLRVFKHGKFILAIVLMILFYGIKDSMNLIFGYSTSFLGWSSEDVVHAGMFNILGVIVATLIVVKVVQIKKENLPLLLLAGFGTMCFYHVWFYLQVAPDLSFFQLCIPIFIQGFASGLLFVPITVFCMATVPVSTGMTAIVICAYARFIATLNASAGFYTLRQDYNQQFKEGFLSHLIPGNDILTQRLSFFTQIFQAEGYTPGEIPALTNTLLAKSIGMQSQLLTLKAIFYIAAVIMLIAFMVLLLQAVKAKIAQRFPKSAGSRH